MILYPALLKQVVYAQQTPQNKMCSNTARNI